MDILFMHDFLVTLYTDILENTGSLLQILHMWTCH